MIPTSNNDKIALLERMLSRVRERARIGPPAREGARVAAPTQSSAPASHAGLGPAPVSSPFDLAPSATWSSARNVSSFVSTTSAYEGPFEPTGTPPKPVVTPAPEGIAAPPPEPPESSARLRASGGQALEADDLAPPPPASGRIERAGDGEPFEVDGAHDETSGIVALPPATPSVAPRPAASEPAASIATRENQSGQGAEGTSPQQRASRAPRLATAPPRSMQLDEPRTSERSETAWSQFPVAPPASSGPLATLVGSDAPPASATSTATPSQNIASLLVEPSPAAEVTAAVVRRETLRGDVASFLHATREPLPATFGELLDQALALGRSD